jgi:hypothetical protein
MMLTGNCKQDGSGEDSMRLTAAALLLFSLLARADGMLEFDLTEPGSFPILNIPVKVGEQTAIVSFTPRKEPTTFVIDPADLTVTEKNGFIGERRAHSLVIEQANVRILILREGGKDL